MRYVRLALLVIVVMSFSMLTTSVFAQTTIQVGDVVEGTRTNADVEYLIELKGDSLVIFTVVATDFDSNVAIFGANGEQLAYDDDSGGNRNPYLAFFVPADGTYIVRVGAFFGQGSGAFTLTVALGLVTPLSIGTPVDVQFNGTPQFFSFDGNAGDVVTISAKNDNYISSDLALTAPDGTVVASNNQVFFYADSQLRRVVLPTTGSYTLKLSSLSISDVTETLVLLVAPDSALSLDDGSVLMVISEDTTDFDVARFTARAGVTYRLSVETSNPDKGVDVYIPLSVDEYGFTTNARISFENASAGLVEFTAINDGVVIVMVRESSFFSFNTSPSNITLSIQAK